MGRGLVTCAVAALIHVAMPVHGQARAFGEATSFNTFCGGAVEEAGGGRYVYATKAGATCPWAFTTEEIMLACTGGGLFLLAVTTDGRRWALNGTAAIKDRSLGDFDEIWKENPEVPGTKVNIGPWMDVARLVCR